MQVRRFFKTLVTAIINDNLTDSAAMMAYYAVMALFPMVIFVGSLSFLVLPEATVMQGVGMASEALPLSVRQVLVERVGRAVLHAGIFAERRAPAVARECLRPAASSAIPFQSRASAAATSAASLSLFRSVDHGNHAKPSSCRSKPRGSAKCARPGNFIQPSTQCSGAPPRPWIAITSGKLASGVRGTSSTKSMPACAALRTVGEQRRNSATVHCHLTAVQTQRNENGQPQSLTETKAIRLGAPMLD